MAEEMSRKERLALTRYLIGKAIRFSPSYLPLRLLKTIGEIAQPFLIAVLPAMILDAVALHASLQRVLLLTLACVALEGCLVVLNYGLNRLLEERAFVIDQEIELTVSRSLAQMDFARLEEPSMQDLAQMARSVTNHASGLAHLVDLCFSELARIVSLAGFVGIMLRLIRTDAASTAVSGFIGLAAHGSVPALLLAAGLCILASRMLGILTRVTCRYDRKFASLGRRYRYFGNLAREQAYAKDIHFFGMFDLLDRQLHRYIREDKGLENRLNRTEVLFTALHGCLDALALTPLYLAVGCKVLAGIVSIGDFYLYISAGMQMIGLVHALLSDANSIDRALRYQQAYKRIEALSDPGTGQIGEHETEIRSIVFENVSFTYPGKDEPTLRDISFTLQTGDRLALVGRNGSGKTTLVKLLLGLYRPQSGRILINGRDVSALDRKAYNALFSVVFQDYKLAAASLAENVAVSESPDEQKVLEALRDAGLEERTARMDEGIRTQLLQRLSRRATDLSGGESQKVAIARALYKDASCFILDEPTAALDPISEKEIFDIMKRKTEGRTALFISHRLSSCIFCDSILVLDSGRIVQEGTHAQLAAEDGLYRQMWEAQAQHYRR